MWTTTSEKVVKFGIPDGGLSLAIGASSVLRSRLRVGSVWDWRGAWLLSTWLSLRRGSAGVWWGSSGRCSAGLLLVEIVVVRHLIKREMS
jgi:hypothetical protein